jgi:hypothetical protein|tara:strand:- start:3240 stop:4649 length:1410 start_codon:yes stop_codon:yes gene_type:complete
MLSRDQDPPALEVMRSGVLPHLVTHLMAHDAPKLQFEAAWALTNIASTDHTHAVADAGAVGPMVQLMKSPHADVREQCMWCLGNVAGDGHELRDMVLNAPGAIEGIVLNLKNPATPSLLRNATWTMSNFCRGKPLPPLELIRPALSTLVEIAQCKDAEVVSDACWALSYISDGSNERIEAIVECGAVAVLTRLLQYHAAQGSSKASIVTPTLRALGNIVTGSDSQTQAVLDAGAIPAFCSVLNHPKQVVRKETCWALSNVAAGTKEQVEALISVPGMMGEVVRIMGEGAYQVAKEACWILTNICTGGEKKHVLHVVENGGVKALCDKLREMDPKVTESLLDALEAILTKCGTENTERLTVMIDECGGIDALEELQQHENQRVYDKAITMVEKWFGAEEDEEDAENSFAPNIEATSGGGAAFGFGCGAPATPTCAPASAAGGFSFGAVAAAPPAAPSIAAAPAFAGFSFS